MNDYSKYIYWPGRIHSVQGISYKRLIQILLSALSLHLVIPFISMVRLGLTGTDTRNSFCLFVRGKEKQFYKMDLSPNFTLASAYGP
jgi:hypothetical protein